MSSQAHPSALRFDEIVRAPPRPGLYAWYHRPTISTGDVDDLRRRMAQSPADSAKAAEDFLREHVLGPYREAPYRVEIKGQLKPEYEGEVDHKLRLSDTVLNLARNKPEHLADLGEVLTRSIPYFSSPIYIGIATTSLKTRLGTHARLIRQYRELPPNTPPTTDSDHSFAYEAVCVRRLLPADLIVYVMEVEFPKDVAQAAEYVLNRINYPLCGRN